MSSRTRNLFSILLSVIASVFFVVITVHAATTISTDVTTGGNLYATSTLVVDGTATLNGTVTLGDAAGDTITLTGNASTSNALTVSGDLFVNGYSTTTSSNGNTNIDGILTIVGNSVLASTDIGGGYTAGSGSGVTIDATGKLQINSDLEVNGNATTTALSGNIATEGTISIASSTPSEQLNVRGDVSVGSSATTTVFLDSTAASTGACFQMRGADGVLYRAYLAPTSTNAIAAGVSWVVEAGVCQ